MPCRGLVRSKRYALALLQPKGPQNRRLTRILLLFQPLKYSHSTINPCENEKQDFPPVARSRFSCSIQVAFFLQQSSAYTKRCRPRRTWRKPSKILPDPRRLYPYYKLCESITQSSGAVSLLVLPSFKSRR